MTCAEGASPPLRACGKAGRGAQSEQGRAEGGKQARIFLERTMKEKPQGFGTVGRPMDTVMQTEPMLKMHAARLEGSIAYLWVG